MSVTNGRGLPRIWRRSAPFITAPRRHLALLAVTSTAAGIAEAGMLVLLVQIAVALSAGDDTVSLTTGPVDFGAHAVPALLLVAGTLALLAITLQALAAYSSARMATSTLCGIRRKSYAAFLEASWALQSQERQGRLQDLMTSYAGQIATAMMLVGTAVVALFNFTAMTVSAFVVHPLGALVILFAVTVLFFVLYPITKRARGYAGRQAGATQDYASAVTESVSLAQEIRVFNVEAVVRRRMQGHIAAVATPYLRQKFLGRMTPTLFHSGAFLFVLGGLGLVHAVGLTDLGALGAVMLLLVRALGYGETLQRTFHTLMEISPYFESVKRLHETYTANAVERRGEPLAGIDRISCDSVYFAYTPGVPALADVSFEVRRGETIGIVGPSGAGKSTLIQLLLRLRDPDLGVLEVNGRAASDFSLDDWYQRIAFVAQEPRVFNGSVAENIRFFREDVPEPELTRAARMAHIHDEILAFPDGYETQVGERGSAISGGQRQRVCLARALVSRPDLIVLDEPTSALDMRSEAMVQRTLADLKGEVTLFIIAHRLSTLNGCDRIMVFEAGRLTAFDTPDVLRSSNSFFRDALRLSVVS